MMQRPNVYLGLKEAGLNDSRRIWASTLKNAGLEYSWIYDLRHTLARRLTRAGVSPILVAQKSLVIQNTFHVSWLRLGFVG